MKNSIEFSFTRIVHVADWYASTYKSDWIKSFFIYYFVLSVVYLISSYFSGSAALPYQVVIAALMLTFIFMVQPSKVLAFFRTRQQRMDLLMLPASQLEKFVVVYLFSGVGMLLLAFLAIFLADATKVAVSYLFYWDNAEWMMTWLGSQMHDKSYHAMGNTWLANMLCIWLHSLFLLGGVLFRRYAWIITTLLVAGFVFLGAWLSIEVFQWVISEGYYIEITNITALLVSVTVLLALLTIVNFVVSYILFCRMQVVGRKWCNC